MTDINNWLRLTINLNFNHQSILIINQLSSSLLWLLLSFQCWFGLLLQIQVGNVHVKLARWQDGDGECVWQDGKWQVSGKCSWWMVPSLPAMGWWTLAMTDTHKIQNICIRKVFCQSLFSRGGNCGHQSKTLQNFNKSPESLHCFYFTFSPCRRDEGFKSSFQYCFPQIPCLLKMAYLNCLPVARL